MAGAGMGLYDALTEWYAKVGPNMLTGPTETINAAGNLNYNACGYLIRGESMAKTLQGGSEIRDFIYLTPGTANDSEFINPGKVMSPQIDQGQTYWKIPWRLHRSYWSYVKAELDLSNMGTMSWNGAFQKFKDFITDRKRNHETKWWDTWETAFFDQPNYSLMETFAGANGGKPHSILNFVNEHPSNLTTANADASGTLWTQKMGITSATAGFSNFVAYRKTYSNLTVDSPTNLIGALDDVELFTKFTPPPQADKAHFQGYGNFTKVIFTQGAGIKNARQLYRASNDRWENLRDPFMNPVYGGHVFVHVSKLDTVLGYPTAASGHEGVYNDTSNAGTNGYAGPRYHCVDTESVRAIFKSDVFKQPYRFMDGGITQPDTYVQYYDTYGNLVCRNPRTCATIYPDADI